VIILLMVESSDWWFSGASQRVEFYRPGWDPSHLVVRLVICLIRSTPGI